MSYPAHILNDFDGKKIQTVEAHCKKCAEYASKKSTDSLKNTAYLAGLLHDMGKYTETFKTYISQAADGKNVRRGSVNHTFAGARYVLKRWHNPHKQTMENLTSELLAYAIGAHHGMFDSIGANGQDGYHHRRTLSGIHYEEAKENFLYNCSNEDELAKAFEKSVGDIEKILNKCTALVEKKPTTQAKMQRQLFFYLSLVARLLSSAVIDGDRRDTAEFMQQRDYTLPDENLTETWSKALAHLEEKISTFSMDTPINKVRQEISDRCKLAADVDPGIYRLYVPTGGGKTLSSLRFALTCAAKTNKKRIVFAVPLLSVLEQNAQVIREFVGNDKIILEHHSNIIQERQGYDELNYNELLIDTWDAPVIITTLVQLLNTLFSGKSSSVRRMSALADSIIIIDEVQSVPIKLLSIFNLALNFLAYVADCTIILCSATQPQFDALPHQMIYADSIDLIPYDKELFQVFRRTQVVDKRTTEGYSLSELSNFAVEHTNKQNSSLIICNTKKQAKEIFQHLEQKSGFKLFHLSTSMCVAHRKDRLVEIECALEEKEPVICVSTQLVEAGVDFSFGCVIRVSAGLDNVVQAAGRCNRHGEYGKIRPVYIVNIKGENLSFLKEIDEAQRSAQWVLQQFSKTPEKYDNSVVSLVALEDYYHQLYADMADDRTFFPVAKHSTSILSMLSDNVDFLKYYTGNNKYFMYQAFKTAGDSFQVFEENTQDMLVPYGEGKSLITDLASQRSQYDINFRINTLKKLRPYAVSIWEHERKKLEEQGGLYTLCDKSVLVLQPGFYSDDIGFQTDVREDDFQHYHI